MADKPLQKPAQGLLGAFQMKVEGVNPTLFGGTVLPVVDVYDQYLAQGELTTKSTALANFAIGQNLATDLLTVPNGKAWRVLGGGGIVVLNAADAAFIVEGVITIVPPSSPLLNPVVFSFNTPQLNALARSYGTMWRPPLFLPAGWTVSIEGHVSANLTVAGFHQGSLLVQEFDL